MVPIYVKELEGSSQLYSRYHVRHFKDENVHSTFKFTSRKVEPVRNNIKEGND